MWLSTNVCTYSYGGVRAICGIYNSTWLGKSFIRMRLVEIGSFTFASDGTAETIHCICPLVRYSLQRCFFDPLPPSTLALFSPLRNVVKKVNSEAYFPGHLFHSFSTVESHVKSYGRHVKMLSEKLEMQIHKHCFITLLVSGNFKQ